MLCNECKDNPKARGIKFINCKKCGCETITIVNYASVCLKCSDKYNICMSCGKGVITND